MADSPIRPGTLYLHVGPPKTGSTALQWLLKEVEPALHEHNITLASYAGLTNVSAYVETVRDSASRSDTEARRFESQLADSLSSSAVVVSGESLAELPLNALVNLRDRVAPRRTSVLFVARPLDRILPSLWAERVRHGQTTNLNDYVRSVIADPSDFARVQHSRLIGRLQDAFGIQHVHVTAAPSANPCIEALAQVLNLWLALDLDELPSEVPTSERHSALSDGEATAQVILNHIVDAGPPLGAVPYLFSTQFRNAREQVSNYLKTGPAECEDLVQAIAVREFDDLKAQDMKFLESREKFMSDYVSASNCLAPARGLA